MTKLSNILRLSRYVIAAALISVSASAFAGVTVSSPANGATVTSPTHIVASATSTTKITYMHVYVDGKNVYGAAVSKVDWTGAIAAGPHSVIVQAWDSKGAIYKSSLNITVSSTSTPPPPAPTPGAPANATVHSNMDQITGWSSCDACSGINQQGPVVTRSASYNNASPSLDGKSMMFAISGTKKYGSALWWKGMGYTTGRHFTTDLYFYLKNSAASQALEFDIYQDLAGKHYVLGVECSLKTSGMWSVYDTQYAHWRPTTAPCNYLAPYTWHHLVTEQESTADGHSHIIALTIDGTKYYLNKYYGARAGSGTQATIGLQLDGNATMTSYSAYYDKVTVTNW